MKNSPIIVDTGYLIALVNPADDWHRAAISYAASHQGPLITTWPVITEYVHYLTKRRVLSSIPRILRLVSSGGIRIQQLSETDAERMAELTAQYQSLPMDLADASLVVLAESLGHGDILSTDIRDFNAYRWKNTKPFNNLLLQE